jgi:hypothetical protein
MRAFDRAQRAGTFYVDPARETQWQEKVRVEEARQIVAIGALSEPELRRSLPQTKDTEREHEAQRRAAVQFRGMSFGR